MQEWYHSAMSCSADPDVMAPRRPRLLETTPVGVGLSVSSPAMGVSRQRRVVEAPVLLHPEIRTSARLVRAWRREAGSPIQ